MSSVFDFSLNWGIVHKRTVTRQTFIPINHYGFPNILSIISSLTARRNPLIVPSEPRV